MRFKDALVTFFGHELFLYLQVCSNFRLAYISLLPTFQNNQRAINRWNITRKFYGALNMDKKNILTPMESS